VTLLRHLPVAIPLYLLTAWPLYFVFRDSRDTIDDLSYRIPELATDTARALASIGPAPFLNHSLDQLVYATLMLLIFGLVVEWRLGWLRTTLLFFGTIFVACLIAAAVLHAIYPEVVDSGEFRKAWERSYSGGSAGALGLDGAFAATSRWPYAWLAAFALWELGLWYFYLGNFTPVFHISALLLGFAAVRWLPTVGRRPRGVVQTA